MPNGPRSIVHRVIHLHTGSLMAVMTDAVNFKAVTGIMWLCDQIEDQDVTNTVWSKYFQRIVSMCCGPGMSLRNVTVKYM